jgi:uncharacterized protein
MERMTRRRFLGSSVAAAGAAALGRRLYGGTLPVMLGSTRLEAFDYGDVQLLDGPMLEQFRANHAYYLALNEDSLLQPFRQKAGLPAPGEPMGGWYSWSKDFDPPKNMTGYIPGHTFGQYMSALARAYAVTGDDTTREKVFRMVRGYAPTITTKFYEGYPLPCYTSDKTACGLIDAHRYAQDPKALEVLAAATDAVQPWLPPKALNREEMAARPHPNLAYTWDESYTLPENFFLAYEISGDTRYLTLAKRFLEDDTYFNPLAAGENVLPGQHAYSHVNALSSASQAYLVLGSEKHLRAARNGFGFVVDTQSFATGGWGPNETFRKPGSGDMGNSLTETHASFETPCGSYGHFKIVRYLMQITGDSRYGDSMERVLYNTILGALPMQPGGKTFYYSDYNNDGQKVYYGEAWPCCSGTFPQVTADYGISSYLHSDDGLYVNLFVPSRVQWRRGDNRILLEQVTQYPYAPEVTMRVHSERPEAFTVHLRVPAWAGGGARVAVNGKAVGAELRPGTWAAIRRTWKEDDRIEYHIETPLRLEAVDAQHPSTQALMAGPLALFATGTLNGRFTQAQLMGARQPSAGSNEWVVESGTGTVSFKTFPALGEEGYRLYQEVG